jgi:hypothetical protein
MAKERFTAASNEQGPALLNDDATDSYDRSFRIFSRHA